MASRLLCAFLLLCAVPAHARDVTLRYTVPATQRACGDSVDIPGERMGTVRVTMVRVPQGDSISAVRNVAGLEGSTDIVAATIDTTVHYVEWIVDATDAAGNPNCFPAHYLAAYPPDTTTAPPGARLSATFYSGNFGTLLRTERPPTIDFDSTGASYSVRFEGTLDVPAGGARLYVVHDDAARLYVDGAWVTSQPGCTDASNVQAWDVSGGLRGIRFDFINCGSPAVARLEWDAGGIRRVVEEGVWR